MTAERRGSFDSSGGLTFERDTAGKDRSYELQALLRSATRTAVPPSWAFWILASHSCRGPDLCARTASLLALAWLQVIVEVPRSGLFLVPIDFPNARFCQLPDPPPAGSLVTQSVSAVHSTVLWYARLAAPWKEVDPSQACDFLILPKVMESVQ